MVELLWESGDPTAASHPHAVKFYEKGDRPRDRLQPPVVHPQRRAGRAARAPGAGGPAEWVPDHEGPVPASGGGLNGDWLISRQRFFGVLILLWYRLDSEPDYPDPIKPASRMLRTGSTRPLPRTSAESREASSAATSSGHLVAHPAIVGRPGRRLFKIRWTSGPGPRIIRTWLFATALRPAVRELLEAGDQRLILDPDRRRCRSRRATSSLRGALREVRLRRSSVLGGVGRPGVDTAFDGGR